MRIAFSLFLSTIFAAALCGVREVQVGTFFFNDTVSQTNTSTIMAGDTIRWVWVDGRHTTTSDTGLWDAPIDSINTSFEFTFPTPGTYPYSCTFHSLANMVGTVVVLASTIAPTDVAVAPGQILSGDLSSILTSDDSRLTFRPGVTLTSAADPAVATLRTTAPQGTFSVLTFHIESRSSSTSVRQKIFLFNYANNGYEDLDTVTMTTSDQVRDVQVNSNVTQYINGNDREMKAKASYRAIGPVLVYPWTVGIDHVYWTLTP
jgi:hypothetical protein